jgi:hypothetical protein
MTTSYSTQSFQHDADFALEGALSTALKDTSELGTTLKVAVGRVAGCAIDAASGSGAHLGQTARSTLMGVLCTTHQVGDQAIETIGYIARAMIRHAAAQDGNLEDVAAGVVKGALDAAGGIGVSAEEAASAAARGALKAAERLGPVAARTVRRAIGRNVGGVGVVAPADRGNAGLFAVARRALRLQAPE